MYRKLGRYGLCRAARRRIDLEDITGCEEPLCSEEHAVMHCISESLFCSYDVKRSALETV